MITAVVGTACLCDYDHCCGVYCIMPYPEPTVAHSDVGQAGEESDEQRC